MATITEEPPPKRRRTEEPHVSGPQADMGAIAQANLTSNLFMGQKNQRQHMWMQGFVPEPRDEQVPRQTQAPVPGLSDRTHLPVQQPPTTTPTSTASATAAHAGTSNLVHYESPVTSAPPSNAPPTVSTASRKSMDRVTSGASVGLPSPVSSDDTMNSPATIIAPKRARPYEISNPVPTAPVLPSNGSPAPRVCSQMQPPLLPTSRPQQHSRTEHPAYAPPRGMQVLSNVAPAPATHSHPYNSPQLAEVVAGPTGLPNWQQMFQRLDVFDKNTLSKLNTLNNVDIGRVALLREAIEKRDWFYVCLSQIHCLTLTPATLPGPASKLSMQSVTYLDNLLCANSKLSFTVLRWLSDFPARIQDIYSSSAHAMYDQSIREVVGFVQRLPAQWDRLVDACKKRAAPPLMDDIVDKFGKRRSPVLETTMFRAIARMIMKEGSSELLEQLHRLDQEAFLRGQSARTSYEKVQAYQAFRDTINELKVYEKIPIELRKRFVFPPKALAAFQIRIPAPTPVQSQGASMNNNLTQRQQSVHFNNQQISHNRHVSSSASATPRHANAPTMPMMVAYGNIPMPMQQHAPSRRLIFLHETEQPRAQPTHPDTTRSALHQAHLRSPTLTPIELTSPRLYRHVTGFALPPRKINKALPVETIEFDVSQELYDVLPSTTSSDPSGALGSRSMDEKACTIRLRCASGTDKALASESSWIEAENYWPDNLYLQCNSHMLEPRRKLHHNRYLPIDITGTVKPGRNQLTVVVNRISTDNRPYEYALAVEIIGLTSHDAIRNNLKHTSATESLEAIKKSLAASDADDADIVVTTSITIIHLFDPHTLTKIFDVPVRGVACPHRDCFDLETFLSQRDPKNKPRMPSVVDCWRCPICRGDVRPHTLIRDGFMDHVREELARKKLLDTRQIVVGPDGCWKPKEEETGGVRSPSLEREEGGSSAKTTTITTSIRKLTAPKVVEIIEID